MRTFTELYEPKFHKLTKIKTQGALFMPNLAFPKTFEKAVFRPVLSVFGTYNHHSCYIRPYLGQFFKKYNTC